MLEHLATASLELTAILLTHHHADQVRAHIARTNASRTLTVTEAYEPELLGSAGESLPDLG